MLEGLELIEPTELYNILNQATRYCALSDPNYLLLLDINHERNCHDLPCVDARFKVNYDESHIITAKRVDMGELPYEPELECKLHVVVYDSNTSDLLNEGAAVQYGQFLYKNGSKNNVKVLKGGYEDFSAAYPFLRTQKIINMPRELDEMETYPTEILPALLYLGTRSQANNKIMQKDLKIKGQVNCTPEIGELYFEEGDSLFTIAVEDVRDSDIHSKFQPVCDFIDGHLTSGQTVLVFADLGISRSATVAIAYVMHHKKWTLEEAYTHTLKCSANMRPIRPFVHQLSKWEEDIHGQKITNIDDPNF